VGNKDEVNGHKILKLQDKEEVVKPNEKN